MTSRLISMLLAAALVTSSGLVGAQSQISIGYQLPLTGDNSMYGTLFKNSADMAVEEFNKSGRMAGKTVVIKYEDSKSDAKEGGNIARKFTDDASMVGVLGDFNSTVSMASAQIYSRQKMPQMSPSASHPNFLKISEWQFRNITTMDVESPYIAKWLNESGLKRYAVVGIQNDWGQSGVKAFKEAATALGNEVVATEFFNPGNRDFRSILTKINRTNPDVILVFMFYEEAASFLQQRMQMNIKAPVYSSTPLYEPKLLELAGPAAEGLRLPSTFVVDNPDPKVKAYVEGYKKRYGAEPSMFAAQGYDVAGIMLSAIEAAGPNPTRQSVRDALAKVKDYPGVTGMTTFDPVTREVTKSFTRLQVTNGKFKVIK